jgi:adenine-specific DNA-methyltransferase
VLRLGGGRTVTLSGVRRPARTISLSAEAKIAGEDEQIAAIVFGPENGAVSQNLVFEAAKEANVKGYRHLYVFGFAIQPDARSLIELSDRALGIPATYVQASPDLTMGDLLKNMRSSQIFSVCGLPEVRIERADDRAYRVHLSGLDVFDPATMETDHRDGADVPAWFLDTDYNGLCFHVCQAFFPRTSAWEGLRNSLRGDFKPSVWQHLSGTISEPFAAGTHEQVAVKVIDDGATNCW